MSKRTPREVVKRLKMRLIELDLTHDDLALVIGCSRPLVTRVLNGERRSPEVRERIAEILGFREEELWPSEEVHPPD